MTKIRQDPLGAQLGRFFTAPRAPKRRTPKPIDQHAAKVVATAAHYTACAFRGHATYETTKCATLAQARIAAQDLYRGGRPVAIYAVGTAPGAPHQELVELYPMDQRDAWMRFLSCLEHVWSGEWGNPGSPVALARLRGTALADLRHYAAFLPASLPHHAVLSAAERWARVPLHQAVGGEGSYE